MIELSSPLQALDRRYLQAPGGFAWWYVDLVDASGNGAVIIWSYGLPFLPGYAAAARRGAAPTAAERPSFNVAIYRGGRLDCYLLQTYEPEQTTWRAGPVDNSRQTWRFGRNRIVSRLDGERRHLAVHVDCPVPGSPHRLCGELSLRGGTPRLCTQRRLSLPSSAATGGEQAHEWTPLAAPAEAALSIRHGHTHYEAQGRGYHDRNAGVAPLHELGIERWTWGRLAFEERELVHYTLWPRGQASGARPYSFALDIDRADGHAELLDDLDFQGRQPRRNLGGLRWYRTGVLRRGGDDEIVARIERTHIVDSGPFYARYITKASGPDGAGAVGFGELIRPGRVDLARHRPLVRMRVHDQCEGRNSMWLPLFTGPRRGRLKRLAWYGLQRFVDDLTDSAPLGGDDS